MLFAAHFRADTPHGREIVNTIPLIQTVQLSLGRLRNQSTEYRAERKDNDEKNC